MCKTFWYRYVAVWIRSDMDYCLNICNRLLVYFTDQNYWLWITILLNEEFNIFMYIIYWGTQLEIIILTLAWFYFSSIYTVQFLVHTRADMQNLKIVYRLVKVSTITCNNTYYTTCAFCLPKKIRKLQLASWKDKYTWDHVTVSEWDCVGTYLCWCIHVNTWILKSITIYSRQISSITTGTFVVTNQGWYHTCRSPISVRNKLTSWVWTTSLPFSKFGFWRVCLECNCTGAVCIACFMRDQHGVGHAAICSCNVNF